MKKRSTPDAIVESAAAALVARGYNGTGINEILAAVKVPKGSFYHYFESKEALVNALFKRSKGAISTLVLDGFPVDQSPREQFRRVRERMTDFAISNPRELAFLELHHHGAYLDAESRAIESQLVEFGIGMIVRAQEQQAIKPLSAALLMELVNGAFLGVFQAGFEGRIPLTRETLLLAEQCCWEAIRS